MTAELSCWVIHLSSQPSGALSSPPPPTAAAAGSEACYSSSSAHTRNSRRCWLAPTPRAVVISNSLGRQCAADILPRCRRSVINRLTLVTGAFVSGTCAAPSCDRSPLMTAEAVSDCHGRHGWDTAPVRQNTCPRLPPVPPHALKLILGATKYRF